MAKFMLSLHDEPFALLEVEAKERGIKVQELIRAVIIPDWVRINMATGAPDKPSASVEARPTNGNGKDLSERSNARTFSERYQEIIARTNGNGHSVGSNGHRSKSLFR